MDGPTEVKIDGHVLARAVRKEKRLQAVLDALKDGRITVWQAGVEIAMMDAKE